MSRRSIAEELFAGPEDDPALVGGRCTECGHHTFPLRDGCPYCGGTTLERRELGNRGTLWTWTSQGFTPKPPYEGRFGDPENGRPWFVGLVELPGQLRVESLLVGCDQESLMIGMPMRLVLTPLRTEEDGTEITTFAFAPDTTPQEAHHG